VAAVPSGLSLTPLIIIKINNKSVQLKKILVVGLKGLVAKTN
jgi:hypothetical protein